MKTVVILLHGNSVKTFDPKYKSDDYLIATVNKASIIEKKILKDREVDYFYCSPATRFIEEKDYIYKYLESGRTFITNKKIFKEILDSAPYTQGKFIYDDWVPEGYPSFMALMVSLVDMGHREFIIYGLDGIINEEESVYIDESCMDADKETKFKHLRKDTKLINQEFFNYIPKDCRITNMNPLSEVTIFERSPDTNLIR